MTAHGDMLTQGKIATWPEVIEELSVFSGEEGDCLARLASSTSSTNPVGVHLNTFSHVVVDNQTDILDVDSSACNICCHQNVLSSLLQATESKFSLLLSFSSVQCGRIVTHLLQTLGQDISALLLVDKYDDGRLTPSIQDLNQLVPLRTLCHHVHNLFNSFHRSSYTANVHNCRPSQVGSG